MGIRGLLKHRWGLGLVLRVNLSTWSHEKVRFSPVLSKSFSKISFTLQRELEHVLVTQIYWLDYFFWPVTVANCSRGLMPN